MDKLEKVKLWLVENKTKISSVVDFDPSADHLHPLDFTATNLELIDEILDDTTLFSAWTALQLEASKSRYGIGGYDEHRTIYNRSAHFDTGEEPRRLHLGVDIWAAAGTPVYNFYTAEVHSFANNDQFGDYGGTVILKYQLDDLTIHALYGHLSTSSLSGLNEGMIIPTGHQFATFGIPEENGHWPPHLHFQLIWDMEGKKGDYPGVCQFSIKTTFLANCPDPGLILHYTFGAAAK